MTKEARMSVKVGSTGAPALALEAGATIDNQALSLSLHYEQSKVNLL